MEIITIKDVEYISFRLAKELLSFNEPIPDFNTRYPHRLESCLATPFQRVFKKSPYPTFISKASILFYLMIKNHPFQNGNKRIAMTTLFVFLYRNGKWLEIDSQELYNFTVWVAESPSKVRKQVVEAIEELLKGHLVNL